jgi:DNA-binding HxlR family transcriptional regulator
MRSYGQFCALAKALDLVGDRWTLLIIRELLIRGGCRYTDLRDGLPGIATNLLADRLRELEHHGIIYLEDAPPPVATTLFHLTERGKELETAIQKLGTWGAPMLATSSRGDAFRTHWLVLPLQHNLIDRSPDEPPVSVEVRTGDEILTLFTEGGRVRAKLGARPNHNATIHGAPHIVMALLLGKIELASAKAAGLKFNGDQKVLRRIKPVSTSVSQNLW